MELVPVLVLRGEYKMVADAAARCGVKGGGTEKVKGER
jgi:hypothetical protein